MDIRPLGSAPQSGIAPQPAAEPNATATPTPVATTGASQPAAAPQPEPSASQVKDAVQKINTALASQSPGIEFSIDSSSHRIVVKIIDQKTNQVLRQIPSKEALAIADSLDQTQGLLIKQQA